MKWLVLTIWGSLFLRSVVRLKICWLHRLLTLFLEPNFYSGIRTHVLQPHFFTISKQLWLVHLYDTLAVLMSSFERRLEHLELVAETTCVNSFTSIQLVHWICGGTLTWLASFFSIFVANSVLEIYGRRGIIFQRPLKPIQPLWGKRAIKGFSAFARSNRKFFVQKNQLKWKQLCWKSPEDRYFDFSEKVDNNFV